MSVSLRKGGNVSLSKEEPGLKKIIVGLGWKARSTDGADFDLDASAFLLTEAGRVRHDKDFIFYYNTESPDGTVKHSGDNRKGDQVGDDEKITIDLDRLAAEIQKVAITVTIDKAEERQQNFGQVNEAYIRVINAETNREIARFDLTEDASIETAMIFGEIYRYGGEWKFRAVSQGYKGGLAALCANYGVRVDD